VGKASKRDAVRVILKELETVGYLVAEKTLDSGGLFGGMAYTVYEKPITADGLSGAGQTGAG
jgi:hypothetical protein